MGHYFLDRVSIVSYYKKWVTISWTDGMLNAKLGFPMKKCVRINKIPLSVIQFDAWLMDKTVSAS